MRGKIVAGLLALTVVTGVDQSMVLAAQAAEQNDATTTGVSQDVVAEESQSADAITTDVQIKSPVAIENDKKVQPQPEAVGKKDNDSGKKKATTKEGKAVKEKRPQPPLTIEGDELYFDEHTGEVHARGKVLVTQSPDTLTSEEMRGNTKTTEVWIDDVATIIQPEVQTTITGHTVHYNYGTKHGEMAEPHGMVGAERVAGKDAQFYPDRLVAHDATMTRCPAKVPDYHVSATKVEIWPGDKLIAYNAKVWIKNTVIYSVAKYQRSLRDDDKSEFPKVGYSNKDGLSLEQYYEYPLTNNWAFGANQVYFTKQGYRPQYSLIDRERDYSFRIDRGDYRDGNSNWVTKEPEFRFDWYSKRIGKLPWSYTFSATYGKWKDQQKTSWHQDYTLYFTRDPIQLSKTLTWYIGTGIENIRDSYDHSSMMSLKFNTTLTKVLTPKVTVWSTYNYTQNENNVFSYNSVDVARELVTGISYRLDRMNAVAYSQSYDLKNQRIYSNTWTWYRNLHCWNMTLSYEDKKADHTRNIRWDLAVTRW